MALLEHSHNLVFLKNLHTLAQQIHTGAQPIQIDGISLDIPRVVAVARCCSISFILTKEKRLRISRHGARLILSDTSIEATTKSAKALRDSLERNEVVYGSRTETQTWIVNNLIMRL